MTPEDEIAAYFRSSTREESRALLRAAAALALSAGAIDAEEFETVTEEAKCRD